MTDPLLKVLARLPQAECHPVRADRTRARCLVALARRPRRDVRRLRLAGRFWEPLVAGLGGVYLTETIRQALHFLGIL